MSKHTPGPWYLSGNSAHDVVGPTGSQQPIARCGDGSTHPAHEDRCAANARLIAAAPDYDQAARNMVSAVYAVGARDCPDIIWRAMQTLEAIIAKAEGPE